MTTHTLGSRTLATAPDVRPPAAKPTEAEDRYRARAIAGHLRQLEALPADALVPVLLDAPAMTLEIPVAALRASLERAAGQGDSR